ncbi:protein lethal(2)essential for life-like isoform X1 [Ctenocephalides felis]|uniref:protein lethal(2)essential for life-like isoform X1 n=1 Tax=Ctenocephalides felis TaxID=7515 RepID=UPI000E6E2963|nr:protein lethal(2)essential for life-like isoform X1 [Ctenocephalides felis]
MSLVPLMFRDWWDDFGIDHPSSRLFDQHFGMGLNRNDLLSSFRNSPTLLRGGYFRPWRTELLKQDSGSTVTADKDKFQNTITPAVFEVILDVQQFSPKEITVKTQDNFVIVEGKHEEKQDEHGFISRHFVRRYMLPAEHNPNDVVSSLSSDGVLTITAPKKALPPPSTERVVPITQTGPAKETQVPVEQNKE